MTMQFLRNGTDLSLGAEVVLDHDSPASRRNRALAQAADRWWRPLFDAGMNLADYVLEETPITISVTGETYTARSSFRVRPKTAEERASS